MTEDFNLNRAYVEALTDKALEDVKLPHPLVDISIWHLLTVAEDQVRMLFAGWIPKEKIQILSFVNNTKYSLRHSINLVLKKASNDKVSLPKRTIPDSYEQAFTLLEAATKYESLCRLIASTYNSRGVFVKEEDGYKLEYNNSVDIRYSVLEGIGHGADITTDITGILHRWLTVQPEHPEEKLIVSKICDSSRVKKGRVTYNYIGHIAYGISQQVPQREEIIPDEFEFSWGKSYKTHALINSLLVRCLYHVFTVELIAKKLKLKGGAESSLVLLVSRQELCNDLQVLADFKDEEVNCFIDMLTYGNKSRTPDLALQPLYLSKSGLFMIPCYQILNSNLQRNLLALVAKTDPKKFDKQSSYFENHMISRIEPYLKQWNYYLLNTEFQVHKVKEEVDVLLLDEGSKTILLLELRWILQPGDAREVYNKIKATSSKVDQLSRKICFFENNITDNINRGFGGKIDINAPSDWKVRGVVVIQGFGGTASHQENIPIITLDVFCKGIQEFECLHSLYLWIKGLSWLPIEGKHYKTETIVEKNDLVEVSRIAARQIADQQTYSESLQNDIANHTTT